MMIHVYRRIDHWNNLNGTIEWWRMNRWTFFTNNCLLFWNLLLLLFQRFLFVLLFTFYCSFPIIWWSIHLYTWIIISLSICLPFVISAFGLFPLILTYLIFCLLPFPFVFYLFYHTFLHAVFCNLSSSSLNP